MKKLKVSVALLCCLSTAFAQDSIKTDSLRSALVTVKADTAKVWAMHDIAYAYLYIKTDSSLWYAQQALALSTKIDYDRGIIRSMNDIANVLSTNGNYPRALEILMDALQKSETRKDGSMQSTTLANIADAYSFEGDYHQAINFTFRALAIDLAHHDTPNIIYDYAFLGDYFEKNGQADSALIYVSQAYQLALQNKSQDLMAPILNSLGNIQSRLGNDDIALPYYNKSIALNESLGNLLMLSQNYFNMANVFKRSHGADSAILYLKKAYGAAHKVVYEQGMLNAVNMLAALYENRNNDSTLKYLKLSMGIKDSIYNQEKIKRIQSLTFTEQVRQADELAKQKQEEAQHRQNIETAAIGLGIIIFIILFLLYSRSIIASTRLISFLGLIALLVTFEFLYLLIDRFLANFTHESTLWMLLIWVMLGALLAPLDNFMEHWIKHRLVEKNKAIKIAAAHKTLETLEEEIMEHDNKKVVS